MLVGVHNHWEFTKALGDAFLIAGIIGTCLELFAASRIIDHASSQVAEKMTGHGLPESARAVIHDLVHNTKRVYRDHRRTYRIERHPEKQGYLIVHGTISYRVVNNGKGRDAYQPKFEEGVNYNPTFESLQFGDDVFTPETIKVATIKTTVTFSPDKIFSINASDANAPADILRPDQQCLIRWSYRMEMPERYSDVTAYTGMTVYPVIELLAKPVDLDFWASEDNNCKHVGDTWTYERAFVAGQHLRAWWRPRT